MASRQYRFHSPLHAALPTPGLLITSSMLGAPRVPDWIQRARVREDVADAGLGEADIKPRIAAISSLRTVQSPKSARMGRM